MGEGAACPGTDPGTGTAYLPTALPTVGPYALPGSGAASKDSVEAGPTAPAPSKWLQRLPSPQTARVACRPLYEFSFEARDYREGRLYRYRDVLDVEPTLGIHPM